MKAQRALGATALFVGVLLGIYVLHVRWLKVDVVFYAALGDAVLATVLSGVTVFFVPFFRPLSRFEKALLLIIWLLGGYAFAISVPTVIDRSLSFYILEKLQQRGGSLSQEALAHVFRNEYMREHRLVEVRLTEQLASGTITLENGCVGLTPKGQAIARFSRFFRKHFLPKKRLLMGEYTDALTDPFRGSEASAPWPTDHAR